MVIKMRYLTTPVLAPVKLYLFSDMLILAKCCKASTSATDNSAAASTEFESRWDLDKVILCTVAFIVHFTLKLPR